MTNALPELSQVSPHAQSIWTAASGLFAVGGAAAVQIYHTVVNGGGLVGIKHKFLYGKTAKPETKETGT